MLATQHETYQTISTSLHTIHQEYISLDRSIRNIEKALFLKRLVIPLVRWFYPGSVKQIATLETELHTMRVKRDSLQISMPQASTAEWGKVQSAYNELLVCKGKWAVTASYATERVSERTPAVIDRVRREIVFEHKNISFIQSDQNPLYVPRSSDSSWFIYPTILVFQDKDTLEVYPVHALHVAYEDAAYIEDREPLSDATLHRQTWKKANIDGTADKRFRDNTLLPIYSYGLVLMRVHEQQAKLLFSNAKVAREFAMILTDYLVQQKL